MQQYALWRLRDQPGQRPLAHFSPQPESRSAARAANQAAPPTAWQAGAPQQQQHAAMRPVINLDLGVATPGAPKQAGGGGGAQPQQAHTVPGSLHELVRRYAGAPALQGQGGASAAPAADGLHAGSAEAAGHATPEALHQPVPAQQQEAEGPAAQSVEGAGGGAAPAPQGEAARAEEGPWQCWPDAAQSVKGAGSGAAAAPQGAVTRGEEGPWQSWPEAAAAASDSDNDMPEEALEWADVVEGEPSNANELDAEVAPGNAAASNDQWPNQGNSNSAASWRAAGQGADAMGNFSGAPAGAPDQAADTHEHAARHGAAAAGAAPDQAPAARQGADTSDRAAQAIAAAARARCDVLRGPPRRFVHRPNPLGNPWHTNLRDCLPAHGLHRTGHTCTGAVSVQAACCCPPLDPVTLTCKRLSGFLRVSRVSGFRNEGFARSSREDPNFQDTYWRSSRLHFIGTWKARLDEWLSYGALSKAPRPTAPPRGGSRAIIHCDMDCFFATVAGAAP